MSNVLVIRTNTPYRLNDKNEFEDAALAPEVKPK